MCYYLRFEQNMDMIKGILAVVDQSEKFAKLIASVFSANLSAKN